MTEFPYAAPVSLVAALREARRIVLASHESPDADGIGSLLALGLALQEDGRTVWRLENGPVPEALTRLPGFERIPAWPGPERAPGDLAVLLDCHRRARLGVAGVQLASVPVVAAIDHHPLDARAADVDPSWLVDDAPSTSMLVHSLLLGWPHVTIDALKASALYAGLLTDTGGFRHANTTYAALTAAADLVRCGADPSALAEALLHRRRPEVVRLTGEALVDVRYAFAGRLAVMVVDRALLARTGARLEETEHLASLLTGIEGVAIGALLREVDRGTWRVSLRARGTARVDGIARAFDGGGHHRAAAFTAVGEREDVESRLRDAVAASLGSGDRGGAR